MGELGSERQTLPTKKQRSHFVQTDRAAHEAWARLGTKHPAAAILLHVLVANIGEQNAIVASHKVLAKLMNASPSTIKRALKTLEAGNWIEVVQIGANGTVNAYVINSRVAWTEGRDKLRYSRLQAEVLASEEEQASGALDAEKKALLHLPRIGELQIPSGQGLPPTSQPSFPGMEPSLPATGWDDEDA
jgi:DNA-binding transcriptional regulator YhcF (GntR family)